VPQNSSSAFAVATAPTRSPSKIEAIGIVVATSNNASQIAQCVAGLFAAIDHSGWHHSIWIVVVADACTDDTAKMARRALGAFGQVLEISARSRQLAHRLGASAVIEHFRHVPRHSLLLTSRDASSEVPHNWIDQQIDISRSPSALIVSG
jgi:hypothetical protein